MNYSATNVHVSNIAVQRRQDEISNRNMMHNYPNLQPPPTQQRRVTGPSPSNQHISNNGRSEQKVIRKEDIPRKLSNNTRLKVLQQVEVECVAHYEELRWTNIGKEEDGMKPQDIQYANALRPPYHLASTLKLAGNSSKGISATNKNTFVFVVMKGELTIVLNTSQFVVRRGDFFLFPLIISTIF